MAVWILKAVVQKSISFLPFNHQLNFFFQKYITRGVVLGDALFEDKLTHCERHMAAYTKYGGAKDFTALEIGTGWYPIVPIGLFLAGAEKIYTIDISSLLSEDRVLLTINRFIKQAEKGFAFTVDKGRLELLKKLSGLKGFSATGLLEQMNITAIVGDARKIDLPDGSIGLVNSNNTFEHIYPEILIDILKEFKRIAKRGGVMSHAIDMSDHFAHLDKSITLYNFLQYSDKKWNLIDNSIQPQNR
ncbi:MAG: hypothetical protein JWO06_2357, partial [Bacteroidota bacterium]|nr:hypothetical protein [Bacteroidota bacterium]